MLNRLWFALFLSLAVIGTRPALCQTQPEVSSLVLWQNLLQTSDTGTVGLAYRYLSRVQRPALQDPVPELLLRPMANTQLKTQLLLGIADSGRFKSEGLLLETFSLSKIPEIRQAAARALGKTNAQTATPAFRDYLTQQNNWFATPLVTEAVILALGDFKKPDAEPLMMPIVYRELKTRSQASIIALTFTYNPQLDRLIGAVAWTLGDLQLQDKHQEMLLNLFASKAVRSSITAAKSLLQWPQCPPAVAKEARDYLEGLAQNLSISLDLKTLVGEALAAGLGKQALVKFDIFTAPVQLAVVRNLPAAYLDRDTGLALLKQTDEALLAEAGMILSRTGKSEDIALIEGALQRNPKPGGVAKAVLVYAWEDIASR